MNPIALAIPVFLLLIVVELGVSLWRRREVYRFHDTISDLACGVGSQVIEAFTKAAIVIPYTFVFTHARLFELNGAVAWIVGLVGVDLCYYAYHRTSHRVNFFWACHAVHHQSEDYNLAVALRQSWFSGLSSWIFYLPLAVLGVPPWILGISFSINLLYQFWVHTELIGRLGMIDRILVTPSNHRVHHAVNPEYLDRNYGGILAIWDVLFGTFHDEAAPAIYGTVKPLSRWGAWEANLSPWTTLLTRFAALPSWREKLYLWIAPPEWVGTGEVAPPAVMGPRSKYNTALTTPQVAVLVLDFAVCAVALLVMLLERLTGPAQIAAALWILTGIWGWGGISEGRPWALPWSIGRAAVGLVVALVSLTAQDVQPAPIALLVSAGVLLVLTPLTRPAPPASGSTSA